MTSTRNTTPTRNTPSPVTDVLVSSPGELGKMCTNRFDRVTAMLASVLWMLATLVSMLVVVWLLSGQPAEHTKRDIPRSTSGTSNPPGLEQDFLEPGVEETIELTEPAMEDRILAVTDAVSRVSGALQVGLVGQISVGEKGSGDNRQPGPPNQGSDSVPRFERWQLDFRVRDMKDYAQQLDFYKIELGLIGGAIQGVDYVSQLSSKPIHRHGGTKTEKRLYFMWSQPSPLKQFDQRLFESAGQPVKDRKMLKFVPAALENQLAKTELEYARAHGHELVESIAKTVFSSQAVDDGFRFVVTSQRYRK